MGIFCVWHKSGERHLLPAGVLELTSGTFHYISHEETAHFHIAKGYIVVTDETKWGAGEGRNSFLCKHVYQFNCLKLLLKKFRYNSLPPEAKLEELLRELACKFRTEITN